MMYTVTGLIFKNWQRFGAFIEAGSAREAEDLVTLECEQNNCHIGVTAVLEGEHRSLDADYAQWILPDATTQEEVDAARLEGGYKFWQTDEPKKKVSLFHRDRH